MWWRRCRSPRRAGSRRAGWPRGSEGDAAFGMAAPPGGERRPSPAGGPGRTSTAGTLLNGIATGGASRPRGVTSDLRARPGTMLLSGLQHLLSTSGTSVSGLPLPALAPRSIAEWPSRGKRVSSVIAPAVCVLCLLWRYDPAQAAKSCRRYFAEVRATGSGSPSEAMTTDAEAGKPSSRSSRAIAGQSRTGLFTRTPGG